MEAHNIIVKKRIIVDSNVIYTRPLTRWERKFNTLMGKTRFKVERTLGGIKRWFNGGLARYRGIEKMHTQNLMEAMCYNLYQSPGIINLIVKFRRKQ
nr:transposase [Psychroflexus torquis]